MIASAATLRKLQPVSPFVERGVVGGMSFGLSLAGYDIRVAQMDTPDYRQIGDTTAYLIFPGDFVLASSLEYFRMPLNMVGHVKDKSTWARRGIAVQNTVIEPGWEGYLTLEITNHSTNNIVIEAGWPIAQILFEYTDQECEPYTGKYQNQEAGPQPARFE